MSNKNALKLNKLENSRINLFNELDGLQPEVLTYKSNGEKWSISQVIYHLVKSEQLTSIAITKTLSQKNKLVNAGISSTISSIVLNAALKTRLKFKAPPITTNMPDIIDFQELKKKWETIRNNYKQHVENYPVDYSNKKIFKHPRAGWLTMEQTLDFLQNHFDHHKAQIKNLISHYINKP